MGSSASDVHPADSPAVPLPLPKPLSPAKQVLVGILVLLGIALAVARAHRWAGGTWSAEVSGYAIGGILMSLLVAYVIAGRKKSRRPIVFGAIFFGISFVLFLSELSNPRIDPKARIAAIVREANGSSSIDPRRGTESPQDKLLRAVITGILDDAKAHKEKVHELQSGLQTLYTPESFSGPQAMSRVSDSVQKVTTLDHEFLLQIEKWPSRVEEQTAQSALSESTKQAFLKGFHGSFSNSEIVNLRKQVDQVEEQWCKDTLALYGFAKSHTERIHVQGAHILIGNENVRSRFNDLLRQSREQHQRMLSINAQLAKLQKDGLQALGLAREDIGLAKPSDSTSK